MAIKKKTFRTGPYQDYFAQGVLVENVVYLSGQIGTDINGNIPDSIADQTRLAYSNMQEVLTEFGADMSNVVDETYFVTDMDEFLGDVEGVYVARQEAYQGSPEVCQTVVQVSGLISPELKIEIKCVAHI